MELLLTYLYTDEIDFRKWSLDDLFGCLRLCISRNSMKPAVTIIRYLVGSLNRTNVCLITENAYELKLFSNEFKSSLKEISHSFFMIGLKFIVGFWNVVHVFL